MKDVSRIDAGLLRLYERAGDPWSAGPASGYVAIEAMALDRGGPALRTGLWALGLIDDAVVGDSVSGRLPLAVIPILETLTDLAYVRETAVVTHVGAVTAQAEASTRADAAKAMFAVDGAGIKVGVLSDSYDTLHTDPEDAADNVAAGDLPGPANPNGYTMPVRVLDDLFGGTDEGRAMLQVVHDMAPGAELLFSTGIVSAAGMARAIRQLADAGAKVIVDDISHLTQPFFQDGIVTDAVNEVQAEGVVYLSAAGNQGTRAVELVWSAGDDLGRPALDFDAGSATDTRLRITVAADSNARVVLQWDQPYGSISSGGKGATTDLDIYALDTGSGAIAFQAISNNLVTGDPVELLQIDNRGSSQAASFDLVVNKFAGPDPGRAKLLFVENATVVEHATNSPAIFGHAAAAGAIAVGAASVFSMPPVIESFSSRGPATLYFERDGDRLATPEVRARPQITAPDGSNNTFFGTDSVQDGDSFPNFFGTSAAAPAAAGVVALMLDALPTATPTQILAALRAGAIDMAPAGVDSLSGSGLIQADAAIAALIGATPGANTVTGGSGDDNLNGLAGNDLVSGLAGDDLLLGDAGADRLDGGSGADTLDGGAGADTLTGGDGGDVFFISLVSATDRISDLTGADRLRVEAASFAGAVTAGTGQAVLLNQVEAEAAAGLTRLFIGTDAVAGSDLTVEIAGTYAPTDFALAGSDILLLASSPPPPPPAGGAGGGGGGGGGAAPSSPPKPPPLPPLPLALPAVPPGGSQATAIQDGVAVTTTTRPAVGGVPPLVLYTVQPPSQAGATIVVGPSVAAGLVLNLPQSVGLTVGGPQAVQQAAGAEASLAAAIGALIPGNAAAAIAAAFAGSLAADPSPAVTVRAITPTVFGGAPPLGLLAITAGGQQGSQDILFLDGRGLPAGQPVQIANVERIGVVGAVDVHSGPDATSSLVIGDGAAQVLHFGAGDDTILGGGGDDRIGSTTGRDLLVGDDGDDSLDGGDDTDTLFGGEGGDRLIGGEGETDSFQFLVGGGGNDLAIGGGGTDALFGDDGDDSLDGGGGTDVLFGGPGDDRLVGGPGQDALVGGTGADVFVVTADPGNQNVEGIFDFSRAEGDKIAFTPLPGAAVQTGADAAARQFSVAGQVSDGQGRLVPTVYTAIDFGAAGAPQILLVGGNPVLQADDFIPA